MKKLITPILTAGGLLALASSPSHAILQIAADVGASSFTCFDNQAGCDTNLAIGTLALNPNLVVNGVELTGSVQQQSIGASNSLNTSSLQIQNNNAAPITITVAVSGTNFAGPVSEVQNSGSGTFQNALGSTVTMEFYADATNTQGADNANDTPGTQLHTFSDTAVTNADSFATDATTAFAAAGLFSMTEWVTGTLTGGNTVCIGGGPNCDVIVNRGQTMIAEQIAVPEPASLAILGGLLSGLGLVLARRRRTAA